MKRFDARITTQKTPILCKVQFQTPGTGDQTMFLVKKEKCRVVCYDIRHLKPPGQGKVWISPT